MANPFEVQDQKNHHVFDPDPDESESAELQTPQEIDMGGGVNIPVETRNDDNQQRKAGK